MRSSTLQLSFPFGRTVGLALLLLTILIGAAEIVLRLPAVKDRLPPPTVGGDHLYFDTKAHVFRELDEKPDCYFLGSSVVHSGFDPAVFEAVYFEQTGQRLTCFNFGIVGGNETTELLLAEMLTREFVPKLLIFGTRPRILGRQTVSPVRNIPWLQYHLGNWSVSGWLAEHSAACGYWALYVRQLTLEQMDLHIRSTLVDELRDHAGYEPSIHEFGLPSVQSPDYPIYPYDAVGAARVDQMMAFAESPDTTVVIVGMPDHASIFGGDAQRVAAHDALVTQVSAQIEAGGEVFLPTYGLDIWSEDRLWGDTTHLNQFGADVLSRWVGEQIGQAVVQGDLVIAAE